MKPVGILGGMGPEATILLMQKVLKAVPARDDADHVPLIVHQNPQVPSRIRALIEKDGTDPGPVLGQMARDLEGAGALALAMPCNTAHHYAAAVTAASSLPFLSMLDETTSHLSRAGARRIGMLASPATRITGVFDKAFGINDLKPIWPSSDEGMLTIIRAVKAGNISQGVALRKEADALIAAGADHLLVACTELSLLTDALPDQTPWTDSLECLVDSILRFAQGSDVSEEN